MSIVVHKVFGKQAKLAGEYDTVDPASPHGIYIYDSSRDRWILVEISDEYMKLRADGIYVIYFDNAKCGACRLYDIHWFPYVRLLGSTLRNTYFIIVLCEWFARNCSSDRASGAFKEYDVHSSPTTVLVYVKEGAKIAQERVEGVKSMDKLASIVEEFARRNNVEI